MSLITFLQKSFLLFTVVFTSNSFAQTTYKIPSNVKKIVFLGNSITYQGHYISYLETILTLENPAQKREYINVGLPSETVSKLSEPNHANGQFPRPNLQERLKRILEKTQPDFIFASYGINDGIYLPFSPKRFHKYKKGMFWLNKQISKHNIPVIYVTPPTYDKTDGEAYSNVMDLYADWLMSLKYTQNWNVIDIHESLKNELLNHQKINPDFRFTRDGIHPKEEGHWIIAKELLQSLGVTKIQNATNINEAIAMYSNGDKIYKLIDERQKIMKDTWLNYTGHKRPNMEKGIPLPKAKEAYKTIQLKIDAIIK
ncbi:SGNH/GDSL hydrolase family protein [Wenyingzhuangia aestuarii]|uniref:SGNH/GDSL hydrolase family protein n=1 Tax=Wenyingzhuangia aestuarii TaxID=1647582 RepID=UPI00143BFA89|nr:SGNH/GDSL hydrolase family protein [Wenyingzhuangia aestuarii]NJB82208.1 lysophospholipase L1-like esterase [Wenyingzhuangia aestuarii]